MELKQTTGGLWIGIRWLIRMDMPAVIAIEAARETGTPWDETAVLDCLRNRNCIGMVAEDSHGRVLGFMIYELHERRLHLLRLAVAPTVRRKGIGRTLLERLAAKATPPCRRRRITLDVPETNLAACLWLRTCGWRAVRLDREVGPNGEDSLRFVWRAPATVGISA